MAFQAGEWSAVRAVAFDCFGTLFGIADERKSPYRQLFQLLRTHGRRPQASDARTVMTADVGLAGLPGRLGCDVPASALADIERDLWADVASVAALPEAADCLRELRGKGYRLALCSNLAKPYAIPVRATFPQLDAYVWSFAVGAVKPEPTIFATLVQALALPPEAILFVGDSPHNDVDGAQAYGLPAALIDHSGVSPDALHSLRRLADLLPPLPSKSILV